MALKQEKGYWGVKETFRNKLKSHFVKNLFPDNVNFPLPVNSVTLDSLPILIETNSV